MLTVLNKSNKIHYSKKIETVYNKYYYIEQCHSISTNVYKYSTVIIKVDYGQDKIFKVSTWLHTSSYKDYPLMTVEFNTTK